MRIALLLLTLALAGCNLLGGDEAEAIAARREADGKAVGGACRHAGRAIEDCYTLNKKADKAAVYAGWREMNDYMRENKLDPVPPQLSTETAAAQGNEGTADGKKAGKAGEKSSGKATAKVDAAKGGDKALERATDKSADKGADKGADKSADKTSEKPADKPRAKDAHSAAESGVGHAS